MALIMALPLALARRADAEVAHRFAYTPPAGTTPRTVHVAGDFNGWSKDATPMTRGADGVYVARVKLAQGRHLYKFVIDGEQWINDPLADVSLEADDGHGGKNSGVVIGSDIRKAPAAQPNAINTDFLRHDPADPEDAITADASKLRIRLRAQAGDVQEVRVVQRLGADGAETFPLQHAGVEGGYDVFAGVVPFGGPGEDAALAKYIFELTDGGARIAYAADYVGPITEATPAQIPGFFEAKIANVQTPAWAKHAVWYQIFPERFRNGDTSNDPDGAHRWQSKWFATLPGEAPGEENFYKGQGNVWKRRYGGDIQGVRQALPYLRKLGINAIYLNPVFEAESMHKYDATDFRHIDDNFGVKGDLAQLRGETDDPATWKWTKSDLIFLDFVQEARRQGFKVIIDGVFNHVGTAHPFFQDVLKNGKKSKYADWFEITDWNHPIQYKAWDRPSGELPVFKKDAARGLAPGPYAHIMAITKRWLAPDGDVSRGVDGFRLDVPGDIPHPFWIEWRKLVKSINPDAYITGEIWQWAQPWLKGDQFDAVMNYQFAMASQDFFIDVKEAIPPSDFASRLTRIAYAYPWQVALAQQNLFDSHDTDRLASMFVNPDRPYDGRNRIQDNGPDYKPDKPSPEQWRRMAQAVTFQMTYVGAPMIYYGDEAGMWSPDDPSNRQPMVWQDLAPYDDEQVQFNEQVFETYRRAIAVRRTLEPLRTGIFRTLLADDAAGVVAFARESSEGRVIVVINRSERAQRVEVPLGNGLSSDPIVNWLDPPHVELVVAGSGSVARPILRVKPDAQPIKVKATATISLPPYGTAVLAPVPPVQSN
ncbi:MAG TPA: alpha-amylase family glycosyl hydrolase [Tepidisphaeraceae bacterium]|nr:alpha-amylase family glycosyl hydrolase [Tepidisphaeraceae bacterium]